MSEQSFGLNLACEVGNMLQWAFFPVVNERKGVVKTCVFLFSPAEVMDGIWRQRLHNNVRNPLLCTSAKRIMIPNRKSKIVGETISFHSSCRALVSTRNLAWVWLPGVVLQSQALNSCRCSEGDCGDRPCLPFGKQGAECMACRSTGFLWKETWLNISEHLSWV